MSTAAVAGALAEIRALATRDTPSLRRVRRTLSGRLRGAAPAEVLAAAHALKDAGYGWVGFELVNRHPETMQSLRLSDIERLGKGLASWGAVDAFGVYVAGTAWLRGRLSDAAVRRWARHDDLWWRRAALVATTVLNTRAHGGRGDAARTLAVAALLVRDREDMVVKALSWALRALVAWDRDAVAGFLADHQHQLAARVRREVTSKLTTGLKHPRQPGVAR
ncbi:MAG: DNA alkylation repair protein [Pseudomonadales bacterium]